MSLRRRLTLSAAAAVAVAVALASVIAFVVVRGQLRAQVDDSLRGIASDVTFERPAGPPPHATTAPLAPGESLPLPEAGAHGLVLPAPPLGGPPGYAQVVRSDGAVAAPTGAGGELPVTDRARRVARGEEDAFLADASVDGTHVRVYTAPAAPGEAIQAARPLDEVDRTLRNLALILGGVGLGGIGLAAGLGLVVARSSLRPVAELTDAAEHVARTRDLSRRIETEGGGELSRLAATFNTMLAALEDSLRAQRSLVADASHELRTPLTSLRTNAEVLARDDLPEPDRERLLADVVAQLEELTGLVGDLVELAREPETEPAVEEVRLDEVVVRAVERAERHAPDVRFTAELEPSVVAGVPSRLDRALANLLDNAARWSPPGGEVEVVLTGDGTLTVRDHGPGIAPEDRSHVFDRFYRAAAARGTPGSGLGLAIVGQVAEQHGGRVVAEAPEGGGALLRLTLPAQPVAFLVNS